MRWLLLFGLVACKRTETVVAKPDPAPSVSTSAKTIVALPKDETRLHGDIAGQFSLRSSHVVVGEPIVERLEVRSTKGPIKIFVGGDQRNEAAFPMHVSIVATDASGAVVCDTVEKPTVWSFGGIGSEHAFKEGEPFVEGAVINALCPALAKPGDYRLTLHRRLASMTMTAKKAGTTTPVSCDVHPVHEGTLPRSYEPCVAMMDAIPSVTSDLSLHVAPFEPKALNAAVATRLTDADPITRERISVWICGWLACACPTAPTDADLLAALPKTLPAKFPASCRAP